MEAGDLVATLHGKCLRAAISRLGQHKEGLSAAARDLYRAQLIGTSRKRKLLQLDQAFHLTRHISSESILLFMDHFLGELAGEPPVVDTPTDSQIDSNEDRLPTSSASVDDEPAPSSDEALRALDKWLYDPSACLNPLPSTTASFYIGDDDPPVETIAMSRNEGEAQTDWTIYHESTILLPTPMQAVMLGLQALDIQTSHKIQSLCDDHAMLCSPPYDATDSCVIAETGYLEVACSTYDLQFDSHSTKVFLADTKYNDQLVVKAFCAWWKAYRQPSTRIKSSVFQMPKTETSNRFDNLEATSNDDDEDASSSAPKSPIENIPAPPSSSASASKHVKNKKGKCMLGIARKLVEGRRCSCGTHLATCLQKVGDWTCDFCHCVLPKCAPGCPSCQKVACCGCIRKLET